jgi:hypothetical protein
MKELDCMFEALKEANMATYTPDSLVEGLASWSPLVKPDKLPAFYSGLAKLRRQSREMRLAWITGKATWCLQSVEPKLFGLVLVDGKGRKL